MPTISVYDAKNRLSALLDEVERGGDITITRRGQPVARLVPMPHPPQSTLAAELRAFREGLRAKGVCVTQDDVKTWIGDGRP